MDITATQETDICWNKAQIWQFSAWQFTCGRFLLDTHSPYFREGLEDIGACGDPFTCEGYWMDNRQSEAGSLQTCADKWSREERRPTTVKQTAWDGQRTDVFLRKGHKHESFNFEDGWRARRIIKKSAKTGYGEKSRRGNRRMANAKDK